MFITLVVVIYLLPVLAIWNGVKWKKLKLKIPYSVRNSMELAVRQIIASERALLFQKASIEKVSCAMPIFVILAGTIYCLVSESFD